MKSTEEIRKELAECISCMEHFHTFANEDEFIETLRKGLLLVDADLRDVKTELERESHSLLSTSLIKRIYINHLDAIERLGVGTNAMVAVREELVGHFGGHRAIINSK